MTREIKLKKVIDEKMLHSMIFLTCVSLCASEWKTYEDPIRLATPNKNGVYEFEYELAYAFSMFSAMNNTPVVFDPKLQTWIKINSTLDSVCNSSSIISGNLDYVLQDVNQFTGLHVRFISINGKIPGDTIVVPEGAQVIMRFKNRLYTEAISVHVHGLDKKYLWYTDGVPFIQQCPIGPNSDYSYRFFADKAGTHFWHGHLGTEFGRGIIGGFVAVKRNQTTKDSTGKPVAVGREYYVLLQDIGLISIEDHWQVAINRLVKYAKQLESPWDLNNDSKCYSYTRIDDGTPLAYLEPISGLLIGNKGWYSQDDLKLRPSRLPLSTYRIKKGENVRFRFVNAGVGHVLVIWLEGHTFTVVASDGVDIKPIQLDALAIFPGERYDIFVQGLTTPTQKNYRFIIETLEHFDYVFHPLQKTIGLANLQYEDANLRDTDNVDFVHKNCTATNKCQVLNCPFGQFPPWYNRNYGVYVYNSTCLNVGGLQNDEPIPDTKVIQQTVFTSGYEEYFINVDNDEGINGNLIELPQGMPYFNYGNEDQIYTPCNNILCKNKDGSHCRCFTNYNFTLGNIVQLTLYMSKTANLQTGGKSHPFHLHGTHFYVMKVVYPSGYTTDGLVDPTYYSNDIPCNSTTCYGLKWKNSSWLNGNVPGMIKNPIFKDTVIIPIGGYVVLRFRAMNPGWWFAHCHFLIHHLKGMAFAVRVGNQTQIPKPPPNFPGSCGIYEAPMPKIPSNSNVLTSLALTSNSIQQAPNDDCVLLPPGCPGGPPGERMISMRCPQIKPGCSTSYFSM